MSISDNVNMFGGFIKKRRIELRKTLRAFCMELEIDPGNYSKLERGILPPPQNIEAREKLATALGFQNDPEDWQQFMDLADIACGRLPDEMLSDKKIAECLPVLFRTARRDDLTLEKLKELFEYIDKEHC